MRTRALAAALALAAGLGAAPVDAPAQPAGKVQRIGYLDPRALDFPMPLALDSALRELGWVEKRHYVFEARWAGWDHARLGPLADELARARVDVIVARGAAAALAARQATSSIPIVFLAVADPVGAGLVKSLARPGGNATGLAAAFGEAAVKQLELLREAVPRLRRVDVVWVGMPVPDPPVWASSGWPGSAWVSRCVRWWLPTGRPWTG